LLNTLRAGNRSFALQSFIRHVWKSCARYVALYPVRAHLVERPEDWRWSSTRALLAGKDDRVASIARVLERVGDFGACLGQEFDEDIAYGSEGSGRPIGAPEWLEEIEVKTGRSIVRQKPGRKPKN